MTSSGTEKWKGSGPMAEVTRQDLIEIEVREYEKVVGHTFDITGLTEDQFVYMVSVLGQSNSLASGVNADGFQKVYNSLYEAVRVNGLLSKKREVEEALKRWRKRRSY